MKRMVLVLVAIVMAGVAIPSRPAQALTLDISLVSFATGLSAPVDIANSGTPGDGRLFVVERAGVIKIVQSNGTVLGTPFLDINGRVKDGGGEEGLLGLVFHPNYASNGMFYVYYNNNAGDIVVSRFRRDPGNQNLADPGSEQPTIMIGHPVNGNHNGGDMNFGPRDGHLYIATGDGGGGGDTANNAQNKNSFLGKILRLSLNGDAFPGDGARNYVIPGDNPFVGKAGEDEIWSLGLRNPWRFGFDRVTHNQFIGDVGQGAQEEVNLEPAESLGGKNYGWRCFEGTAGYNTAGCAAAGAYDGPIGAYNHASGRCSVTGGYAYRGNSYPLMNGHYLFADYCSGHLYTLTSQPNGIWEQQLQTTLTGRNVSTFGESVDGEMFAADVSNGTVYRVQENTNPDTFRVYRLVNYATKERLFTQSVNERDLIHGRGGWVWEGFGFMAAKSSATGAVPVYRLANFISKERLFTASAAERDALNGHNGWVVDGVAFYGVGSGGGALPVYRMANSLSRERLYTTSQAEINSINGRGGWVLEGVAWQAPQ